MSWVRHELGCCLKTDLQHVVTTGGWIASGDLFSCRLTEWSTIVSVIAQGAPFKRLQSHGQNTVGRLTIICDLTQWESNFLFVFFLLCSSRKSENRMLGCVRWWPATGWRNSNALIPNVGTRPSMQKHEQHLVWWRACVWVNKIHIEGEREIGTKETFYFLIATITK